MQTVDNAGISANNPEIAVYPDGSWQIPELFLKKVIAIDFDGCISENRWPDCGRPNLPLIAEALREQKNGAKLILWTCRSDQDLANAVEYCRRFGLEFDAVNENVPERTNAYTNDCRKVWADEYWDDRAVLKRFSEEE